MQKDFIITLAWPEGMVSGSGAWYDKVFSKKGKYRVGHSAMVLVDSKSEKALYFDFGRYHTPLGFGRVRDVETDPDVALQNPLIKNNAIINIKQILLQLSSMKSTHGEGKMYASIIANVNFSRAFFTAKSLQNQGMLPYGPFTTKGTNCSRFVARIINSSGLPFIKKLRLKYQICISPSPKRNVSISNNNYYVIDKNNCTFINKSKIWAYFSSIER